jgi:hypothetical protein
LESLGLIGFYFVYVLVVIVGHVIYSGWKRQRQLLDPILVEMEDDDNLYIDDDVEELSAESLLRPLLGGMRNSYLIPHDSYRSPLSANRRESLDLEMYDNNGQVLTRMLRDEGEARISSVSMQSTFSYSGIVRQLIPIYGRWKYLSSWKRFQYFVLSPAVFAFGIIYSANF